MVTVDLTSDRRPDLWHEVIALGDLLDDWVLVGGLMVTLWAAHASVEMGRTTTDIDAMFHADAVSRQPKAAADTLLDRGYRLVDGQPIDQGDRSLAFRFVRGDLIIDLLVPSKSAGARRRAVTLPPNEAVAVPGGSYALAHAVDVDVQCRDTHGTVPVTSPLGGLLIKAKASANDRGPARARHTHDLAVLWACLDDPSAVELGKNQRAVLRRAAAVAEWSALRDAAVRARAQASARIATGIS